MLASLVIRVTNSRVIGRNVDAVGIEMGDDSLIGLTDQIDLILTKFLFLSLTTAKPVANTSSSLTVSLFKMS